MAGPTITLTIAGDARDAKRAMSEVGSAAEGMNGKLGKSSGGFDKWRKRLVGASTAVVGAAGLVGKELVGLASEAEQSLGSVDSVFKGSSGTVKQWANDAATSLGLSAHSYREMATVLGSQLKNLGTSQKDLAGDTNNLIKLGSDLAATYGGTTADAVSALSSLRRSEADQIARYSVSIKQSDINARLAAKGLDNLTGTALRKAEQQERMAMLTEQTKDSKGAFAREANTAAGQQQRLTAQWENFRTELGARLLPILTNVMGFISGTVVPWLQRNKDTVATLGIALTGLAGFVLTANAAFKVYTAVMRTVRGVTLLMTAATKEIGR